jgi:adenine-specific DNA-methyltransferase
MNIKFFRNFISQFTANPIEVNRLIVSTFLDINHILVLNNKSLLHYVISVDNTDWQDYIRFKTYFLNFQSTFSFEDLIEIFEFVVSPIDKRINGAIYTPEYIKEYIIKQVVSSVPIPVEEAKFCDVACGCGGFLFSYAKYLNCVYGVSYHYIYSELLFGVDITQYSIDRSEIILSLLALYNGEDTNFQFNIKKGNSLDFDWLVEFPQIAGAKGFDVVIGNPPYVCAKHISLETRELLEKWPVALSGNPDLYIPFFQVGIDAMHENGILGYITVNTFTKSVNGRLLRQYFNDQLLGLTLVDFGGEQVFKGRTTYTCICIIDKKPSQFINYCLTRSSELNETLPLRFSSIAYSSLNNHKGWNLSDGIVRATLDKLRNNGVALERLADIRGGFATLKNSVFLFKPKEDNGTHYRLETSDKQSFWIEKSICRNAVKANSLKSENDLNKFLEKIIFPYRYSSYANSLFEDSKTFGTHVQVLPEDELKIQFPGAYYYLDSFRSVLATRDKGKGQYDAWYAYGRSQGLITQGYKLLFPHISDAPYFVYTEEDLLFYNGFSIVSWNREKLKILQVILSSKLFWFFVKQTSKPYSSDFYGLGKNFIKDFAIPEFTQQEEHFLINCQQQVQIEDFLADKYNLTLESRTLIFTD